MFKVIGQRQARKAIRNLVVAERSEVSADEIKERFTLQRS